MKRLWIILFLLSIPMTLLAVSKIGDETLKIGRPEKYVTICNGIEIEPFETALAEMDRDAGARKGGKQVQLAIESEGPRGRFTGCLLPALRGAGVDWTTEYLKGYLGQAFTFAMQEDGSRLNHDESYDWHHIYEMLEYLDYDITNVSLREGNSNYATPEGHDRAKAEAWEKTRRSIDDGYPAVAWQ